jgi:hypothetical protein
MVSGGIAPPFLISALDGGQWSVSRPGRFTAGQIAPGTHWIGGWMGSRTGLDAVEKKSLAHAESRTTVSRPSSP